MNKEKKELKIENEVVDFGTGIIQSLKYSPIENTLTSNCPVTVNYSIGSIEICDKDFDGKIEVSYMAQTDPDVPEVMMHKLFSDVVNSFNDFTEKHTVEGELDQDAKKVLKSILQELSPVPDKD